MMKTKRSRIRTSQKILQFDSLIFNKEKTKKEVDITSLTSSQLEGWNKLVSSSENFFITGYAGTGKTYLVKKLVDHLVSKGFTVRVIASTGLAAVAIGGCTFHSFFGIGLANDTDERIIKRVLKNKRKVQNILKTDIIIIDEISMISGRLLNLTNEICKEITKSNIAWGNKRVIFTGDFGQLPPITKSGESDWAFNSTAWIESRLQNVFLIEPVRSKDLTFLKVLDKVRFGKVDADVISFVKQRVIKDEHELETFEGARLFSTKNKVEEYNQKKLDEIDEPEIVIETSFSGDPLMFEKLENSLPIPKTLIFKKGALVMTRVNEPINMRYINGTLGRVIEYNKYEGCVVLEELETKKKIYLKKHDFEWRDDKNNVVASATNYPICLAWAITIHKSQGCSLERMLLDMEWLWECGQAYVGLSRSSNPDNLKILNPNSNSIKADVSVLRFYENLINDISLKKEESEKVEVDLPVVVLQPQTPLTELETYMGEYI